MPITVTLPAARTRGVTVELTRNGGDLIARASLSPVSSTPSSSTIDGFFRAQASAGTPGEFADKALEILERHLLNALADVEATRAEMRGDAPEPLPERTFTIDEIRASYGQCHSHGGMKSDLERMIRDLVSGDDD